MFSLTFVLNSCVIRLKVLLNIVLVSALYDEIIFELPVPNIQNYLSRTLLENSL